MEGASGLRVSDHERDQTAQHLRDHFATGRLTQEELDERLQAAYAARTEPELERLLADLPRLPVSRREQKAELAERRRELQRQLVQQTGGGMSVFLVCTLIWLASGASSPFWPVWVAIMPAVFFVRNVWRLYGPAPQLERVERELQSRGRHRHHRRHHR